MLINTRDLSAQAPTEMLEELSFEISREEADEEFAMEVMSAQLYSDKLKIIAQEYLTNARDAQREAGRADIPVKVHLPALDEPWYEVSDCGNGISPFNFKNIFMRYFASTKRGNDVTCKRQNGGFGLGAKSAWSYVPEFFVNTVHDGIEYRYHCYRNLDKKRRAALISKSRIGADEHNGTTVRINIPKEDIGSFIGKFRDITLLWGVKPKIVNGSQDFYLTFKADDIIYENNDVTVFARNRGARNNLTALVDDIPYPVDIQVIKEFLNEGERKFVINAAAYIHCDKLQVDPTPNRENLEYNIRTRDYIVAKVKESYDSVYKLAQSKIDAATSYWNACCLWYSDESIRNLCGIVEAPKYNGIPLPNDPSNCIKYINTHRRGKEKTSVSVVYIGKSADGVVRVTSVGDTRNHHVFHHSQPMVFQVGGRPDKCVDKLVALFKTLSNDTVNHPIITSFNLVRLPSEVVSQKEVIAELEKNYNWSKILKYDLAEVVVPKVKADKNKKKVQGIFYEITHGGYASLNKVTVDFSGRHDIYVAIKNKTVTIMGKRYRFDSNEVCNFKKLTGIDFNQVKLFAVPERFFNRIAKVKTMRSLDQAVTKAVEEFKKNTPLECLINKFRNRGTLYNISSSIYGSGREVYNAIKGTISEDTILARVMRMKDGASSNGTSIGLSDTENLIIWYLRITGVDVDGNGFETPEIIEARKLVKIYKDNYDRLFEMISVYAVRGYKDRCEMMVDIINMIEGKIATSV